MGLFKKKEKKKEVTSLPQLPRLPDFPRLEDPITSDVNKPTTQLPSFPSNSLGNKFSQNTIKDAVTGKKEVTMGPELREFGPDDIQIPEGSLAKPMRREMDPVEMDPRDEDLERRGVQIPRITREAEPVFIRIDKFEESLHIFQEMKKKISDIEKALGETKTIKEKEERELKEWENELRTIKNQIEKIDRDIFSKI